MSVVRSIEEVADGSHLETPTWVTSFQGLPRTVNVRRCRLEVGAGAFERRCRATVGFGHGVN